MVAGVTAQPTGAARAGGGVEMPQTLCVCLEWLQGLRHSLRGQQEPGVGWRCLRLYVSVLNGCRGYGTAYGGSKSRGWGGDASDSIDVSVLNGCRGYGTAYGGSKSRGWGGDASDSMCLS